MFDLVHENKRVVQIILLVIVLPFAFWGVSSYRQTGGGDALATVEGEKITQQEFDSAMRQQQDRIRQMMRGGFDPAMFDNPEVKRAILDKLINDKLIAVKARSAGLTLSDEQMIQLIAAQEPFQKNGKFDKQTYEAWLNAKQMSAQAFQSHVKEELAARQLVELFEQGGYASTTAANNLVRLTEQQRVVSVAQITPDSFLKQVKVEDAAVKKYYESNQREFATPERARVEYVLFSADSLLPQMTASADEIKSYYDNHPGEFSTGVEQRHAAHILIAASAQANDAEKKAAREKAESVLQEVKKSPEKFAELAKKYSADPGSAANGGDLGFFGRGMMVKPFEDAAFGMKPGEISGLVQSDFGFHIVKLLEAKTAKIQPLEEVKASVVQKVKLQKAGDKFAELAGKFGDAAYEQSDSLKPAAELVKTPVQQSAWLVKGQRAGFPWTDKALQAVFSEDVLKKKRNSSAVEIASDALLAVRLLEYKPADTQPFAEVSEGIRQKLARQQANELAVKQGEALLAQLQRGEKADVKWASAKTVTRMQRGGLDAELANRILKADVSKQLPVYVGAESAQGGYALARVEEVKEAGPADDAKRAGYLMQLRRMTGEELLQAYVAGARKNATISVKPFAAPAKG